MQQTELIHFIVLTLIILLSQYTPTVILLFLDNFIIRIGCVAVLLYLLSVGPTVGIFGLMVICLLYLERNRRKVSVAIKRLDEMDTKKRLATVKEATTPQKTVPVNEFDKPADNAMNFLPANESIDTTMFEPVDMSINQKDVLSSIYPSGAGSGSADIYQKMGFVN
jgi:hypothetical protein